MPQIKLKEFVEKGNSIGALLGAKIDPYAAFRLRKFLKVAIDELTEIEKTRQELVKKYGTEQKDGNFQVQPEQMDAFGVEWDKILDEEIVLPNVVVKIRELEKANLSTADIMNLDFILDQEDDGAKSNIIKLEK